MRNEEVFGLIKGREGRVLGTKYEYEGVVSVSKDRIAIGGLNIVKTDILAIEMNSCCVELQIIDGGYGVVGL